MAWAAVIFAGLSEILGVIGIKGMSSGKGKKYFLLMGVSFLLSFSLLSYAMQSLSMGTAYAVWTGIGTVGSTIVGMFIFGEPKEAKRVLFIAMILCSAVGLKLIG
ncbi:DMT family transporter [Paenibacillus shunpengii]|uniref:DMT family transporter n=1 Tax=Paenibacillus shunpengii TaxID=2054424 RepID=A0ABW5SVE4_9BACL|nr:MULTISPECIES: multidrug efflux SMR transporter [unclassified Paenibacillus]OMC66457.1 QacE family quaternary ammonium compound efflux SMR transporter [Paenibacillus sp. FSL H7-0326]SDW85548.1 paired small multidrug resistance pump [Paenibacillus sp. PDC88]